VSTGTVDEMEQARAGIYRLLGAALSHPPTAALLATCRALPVDQDDNPLGVAFGRVARAAAQSLDRARRDYDTLFVGIARGELMPYASFYLTGFLHDRPLARLREDLAVLGLAAAPGHPDPEDHAGTLCESMAGLIDGGHGVPVSLDEQQRFFDRHLEPWIGQFFADLAQEEGAELYASLGALGQAFLDIERAAFHMESS
jgi:TorA maturation chaperone TorD